MAAGYRQGNRGSAGFSVPGKGQKDTRRGFLTKLMMTAAAVAGGAVLYDQMTGDSRPSAPAGRATPAHIADYFIDVVLVREAEQRNRKLNLTPAERTALRDAIIRYEEIELTADDALTHYADRMNEDEKTFVKERIDYHLSRQLPSGLAGIRALQDLDHNRQLARGAARPRPSPDYAYEIYLRNKRFNEAHGEISEAQARELSLRLREDWKTLQERKTIIDVITDSGGANQRGLRNYWSARDWTISHAQRELDEGTYAQTIADGRRRSSAPVPPPAASPP